MYVSARTESGHIPSCKLI